MANPYLVTQLLADLRAVGRLPSADSDFAARMLGFLNRSQDTYLAALLLDVGEQHRLTSATVALPANALAALVPSRAIGAKIKMLQAVSGASTRTLNPMPAERERYSGQIGGDYYFEGNHVVLVRPVEGSLRFVYYRRLGRLVPAATCGEITGLNTALRTVTVTAPTPAFPAAATAYDFVQAKPHFDVLGADESATRSGNVLTFANALPADLAVGDYVALAGETPICQAPVETHPVLLQHALVKYFEAKKDKAAVELAKLELLELREIALRLLAPRADGTREVIVRPNAVGLRRGGRRR